MICPVLSAPDVVAEEPEVEKEVVGDVLLADDVPDLKGVALMGDPIVGVEVVTHDERRQGARSATPPSCSQGTDTGRQRET